MVSKLEKYLNLKDINFSSNHGIYIHVFQLWKCKDLELSIYMFAICMEEDFFEV